MNISVVTIVKNRYLALTNLIKGFQTNYSMPAELVVVHMNEEPYHLQTKGFKIRQISLQSPDSLPLAEARNLALRSATENHVVFLDADCIPQQGLIEHYAKSFETQPDQLLSGRVSYLTKHTDLSNGFERLPEIGIPDPIRKNYVQYPYELFWSLNFGCSKATFEAIGGFDEGFTGYGAEDTDFAFSARKNGIGMYTIGAMGYHQHHDSYDPPLNHFADILSNARRFKQKWGQWPMEGWLKRFEASGLITFSAHELLVLREPTADEIKAAIKA